MIVNTSADTDGCMIDQSCPITALCHAGRPVTHLREATFLWTCNRKQIKHSTCYPKNFDSYVVLVKGRSMQYLNACSMIRRSVR